MKATVKSLNGVVFAVILALFALGLVMSLRLGQLPIASAFPTLNVQDAKPHPFGVGSAAEYGDMYQPGVDPSTGMPFGPGWAADYGIVSEPQAADYGLTQSAPNHVGPEIAATYGNHSAAANPFGPVWAATYGVPGR